MAKWVESEKSPPLRARGIYLLAQLSHGGRVRMREMLRDEDPQRRLVAFRALRRAGEDPTKHAATLAVDESPAVRRGIAFLHSMQRPDGSFPAQAVNGVFFGTAMLDYRLYNTYFPTWALARFEACRHAAER